MQSVLLILLIATMLSVAGIYVGVTVIIPLVTTRQYCARVSATQFKAVDGSEGAGSSDLHYFILSYDCRNRDVVVSGEVSNALHWQIGAFDGALRLVDGGYVNNHTANIKNGRFEVVVSRLLKPGDGNISCEYSTRGLLIYRVLCAVTPPKLPTVQVRRH